MSKPRQPPRRRRSRPAHPETPRNRLAEIRAEIQEVQQQIEHSRQACRLIHNAAELTVLEQEITRLTDRLAQLLIAETLPRAADDPQTNQQARSLFQGAGVKLKNQGKREVTIRTTRGSLAIRVTSYSRNCDRSREHKGLDPAWLVWGVHDGWTPGLASEVSQLVAMLGSLAEVEHLLEGRGHDMSINTIRGIAYRFAARARAVPRAGRRDGGESVLGRRVVISTDGGRLRIRTTKRGPKTAKGRNRYRTDWSEPKLLMIYIRDEPGKREREFLAVIDGTRRGPEAILALMACYVRALKIETADQILLIADGARWIWNRVESLVRGLGIKPGQMHSLVDFYHAVEHRGAIAGQNGRWTTQERKTWVKRQRRRLLKGQIPEVLREIEELCGPRCGSVLKRERGYFRRNITAGRMDYHRLAEKNWPIGSGAMESAIRRVINLRLKGAGVFWHQDSAEAVLILRAYYKAGRWKNLENQVLTTILEDAA